MEENGRQKIRGGNRFPIKEELRGYYLTGSGFRGFALKLCLHSKYTVLT